MSYSKYLGGPFFDFNGECRSVSGYEWNRFQWWINLIELLVCGDRRIYKHMGYNHGNYNLRIADCVSAGIFGWSLGIHAGKSKRKCAQTQLYCLGWKRSSRTQSSKQIEQFKAGNGTAKTEIILKCRKQSRR